MSIYSNSYIKENKKIKLRLDEVVGNNLIRLTIQNKTKMYNYFKKAKVTLYTNGREENFNLLTDSDVYRLTIDINKKEEEDMAIKKKLFEALNDRK